MRLPTRERPLCRARWSHRVAVVVLGLAGCAAPPAFRECRALIEGQAAAWNRGDLDGFCAGYRDGPDTVFAGASGVHLGFDAMVARYRARYPDAAAMGRLTFSDLVFTALAGDHVAILGRWRLSRATDRPSGRFVVVCRRFDEGWRIVLDYTTSD